MWAPVAAGQASDMSDTTTSPPQLLPTRTMRRSATDRKLLGVCAGFAEHYGMDPLVVRIAVAVLALFGGLGVVLYLAGAAWLPEPGDNSDILSGRRLLLLILAALAALVIVPNLVLPFGDGTGVVVVIALIVLLVLLARRPAAPVAADPPTEVLDMTSPPVEEFTETAAYAATPYPRAPYPQPPEPQTPRQRSYLGVIALCLSLIWFGLAWTMNAADLTSMSAVTIFGVSLAILGGGILVGAWIGRARWLVLLALPLALTVWGLSAVPDGVRLGEAGDWAGAGIGETVFQPTAANPDDFEWGFGTATIDVADWEQYPSVEQISASVGVGEIVITVPDTWDVVVAAEVGAGSISRDSGPAVDGADVSEVLVFDSAVPDAPRMRIDASVAIGNIRVSTMPPVPPIPPLPDPAPVVPPITPQDPAAITPEPITPEPITPEESA